MIKLEMEKMGNKSSTTDHGFHNNNINVGGEAAVVMEEEPKNNNNNDSSSSSGNVKIGKVGGLLKVSNMVVRLLATASSVASAWLILTCRQTAQIYGVEMVADYHYSTAFEFLGYANVVGSVLVMVSLCTVLILNSKGRPIKPTFYFLFFISDLVVMCLVLAACAAATGVGYVGKYGMAEAGWLPICDKFVAFCRRTELSVAFSYLSFFFLLTLTAVSAHSSRT